MASNPIQRRTRNSFLLGMVVMLLIAVVAVALLYFVLFRNTVADVITKGGKGTAYAYRLTSALESGEDISANKIELVELYTEDLPADYINDPAIIGYKSKLNLQAGTILSKSLIYKDNTVSGSTRLMEYNMLTLPSTIKVGDYVDVRFTMPSGQDYIVLAKKQVMNLQNTTITFYLTEDEILMMSSAIIESYIMSASDLHVVQYVEAGMQDASIPTYSINAEVYQLIQAKNGVNIEDYSKINSSYSEELRRTIEQEISQYGETELGNIETGIKEQKENAMSLYLSGLSAN